MGPATGHPGFNVPDLRRAVAFYDRIMPLLVFETHLDDAAQHAHRPTGGKRGTHLFLDESADPSGGYSHHRTGLRRHRLHGPDSDPGTGGHRRGGRPRRRTRARPA
ncbi:hypothetical protein OG948_52775 (plasmid) [Embleya sp. NBC_00888]|uniref:hypothetical protein n=1 Tax=Embleya sp. NBC_00888 TaxID=2975960 RepID=UPI002F910A4B|nr:hypothetical protein OG948_52775 [Embleya sp. NBC_00888]